MKTAKLFIETHPELGVEVSVFDVIEYQAGGFVIVARGFLIFLTDDNIEHSVNVEYVIGYRVVANPLTVNYKPEWTIEEHPTSDAFGVFSHHGGYANTGSLSLQGDINKTWCSYFPTRNQAVIAYDNYKIKQAPKLGTEPPTPWRYANAN